MGVHIKDLEGRLDELERQLQDGFSTKLEVVYLATKVKLDNWEYKEELRLTQMAKKAGMVDGDQNSKFFHAFINQRRNSKFISSMTLVDGMVLSTPEKVRDGAVCYFQNFLSGVAATEEANLSSLLDKVIEEDDKFFLRKKPTESRTRRFWFWLFL